MDRRDQEIREQIGLNLKVARTAARLTQEGVARAADMPTTTYARLEQGDTNSGILKYVYAANAIGLDLDKLFHGVDALLD